MPGARSRAERPGPSVRVVQSDICLAVPCVVGQPNRSESRTEYQRRKRKSTQPVHSRDCIPIRGIIQDHVDLAVGVQITRIGDGIPWAQRQRMEVEASGAISYSERRLAGIAVVQEEIGLSIAGEIAQPQEGVPRGQRVGQI